MAEPGACEPGGTGPTAGARGTEPGETGPEGTVATDSAGSGPELVLVHGVGSNRSIFSRVVPILAAERRVTTLDLPGFGGSPPPADGWTIEGVADRIALALAERIDPPFDLVGSSLGGAVSLALASRHPQLVRRLVLQAPAGFRPAAPPLGLALGLLASPWLGARRRVGMAAASNRRARRVALAGTVADGAELSADDARLILRASGGSTNLAEAFRAAASADLRAELDRLRPPLGLIWGEHDRIVPPMAAERIWEIRPDAPIERIAGCGHLPHVERPERTVEALERVLSQLP